MNASMLVIKIYTRVNIKRGITHVVFDPLIYPHRTTKVDIIVSSILYFAALITDSTTQQV